MARRFDRLCKRLQSTEKPIVWLRAMPGSGKTRLLAELRRRPAALRAAEWLLLDDPSPDALQVGLVWWVVGISLAGAYFTFVFHSFRGKVDVM